MAKTQLIISSMAIKDSQKLPVSAVTIRDNKDISRKSPQSPIVEKKTHLLKWLQFAKEHTDWPEETRSNIYGPMKTVKHGGEGIMIWGCLSYYGVRSFYHTPVIMNQLEYIRKLEEVMIPKWKHSWNGCFNKTATPNAPVSSSFLVPDQPD